MARVVVLTAGAALLGIAVGGEEGPGPSKTDPGCLQAECHAAFREKAPAGKALLHGPVGILACDVCHTIVDKEAHTFEPAREEEALCGFCHGAPKALATVHKPFEKQACLACHDPHSGADRRFLTGTEGEVCLSCHEKEEHPVAHPPYGEDACSSCHAAHQSEQGSLLRGPERGTCLGCHAHAPLAKAIDRAKSVHKPVADGRCAGCHPAHGGDVPGLLAAAYPLDLYAPFSEESYELCFTCHDSSAFTEAESEETGFRDGKRNLHHLHVVAQEKDRTCRACHDPHAAASPKLVPAEVAFGDWKLPIGFEATPDGGTCASGCHRAIGYRRSAGGEEKEPEAEDPEPPPEEETPGGGDGSAESGSPEPAPSGEKP